MPIVARLLPLLLLACFGVAACTGGGAVDQVTPSPTSGRQSLEPSGVAVATVYPQTGPQTGTQAWVRERLQAVSGLYDLTPAGEALLGSLDVRQMRGQPGFFGSYGFRGWTGLGEAKPTQVIHELGHSYWGGFPVTGRPELSWETTEGLGVAPAMRQYRADVVAFLAQPPDSYELFRQRLKNLPELRSGNLAPLFHTIEADMVYMTGGDLELVPPILRKYWDQFLRPGPFRTWDEAAIWYLDLTGDARELADRYLGFQHLDMRGLQGVRLSTPSQLNPASGEVLRQEQLQRLWDFTDQFDLLIHGEEERTNFKFWRGYLREIMRVHQREPGYLRATGLPRAPALVRAFDFLASLDGVEPADRAGRVAEALQRDQFVANFLPVLDNETLLEMSASQSLPPGGGLMGTAAFVERLWRYSPLVRGVVEAGRAAPLEGAAQLRAALSHLDLEDREETDLFFELLRDSGRDLPNQIAAALDKETKLGLLKATPVVLRSLLGPAELARSLDITGTATPQQMADGIRRMAKHPSGNFRIDEPYWDTVYRLLEQRGGHDPEGMLAVIASSPLPMEPFIHKHPKVAASILSSDIGATLRLVRGSDPVILPPARFVYSLIFADPSLAARIVARLDQDGASTSVIESLAHLAYDKKRAEQNLALPISLPNDGLFLSRLLEEKGDVWLTQKLGAAVSLYRGRAANGEVATDFLREYEATLEAAAGTTEAGVGSRLLRVIRASFS